jgi:hypothetical protein
VAVRFESVSLGAPGESSDVGEADSTDGPFAGYREEDETKWDTARFEKRAWMLLFL